MVDLPDWLREPELKDRLRGAIKSSGMTISAYAAWLGVSPNMIYKYLRGSVPEDDKIERMAGRVDVDFRALRYGVPQKLTETSQVDPSQMPDAVTRIEAMQLLESLPPEIRAAWLSYGHWLVESHTERGPQNPFGWVAKNKRPKEGTQ